MRIINKSPTHVKIKIENLEDIWYLSQMISPEDHVKGTVTRKIKMENNKTTRKKYYLTLNVEKIEYQTNTLRVLGKTLEEKEDIPKDSYQGMTIEEDSEVVIRKKRWGKNDIKTLNDAVNNSKKKFLLALFDREEVIFALIKNRGYELLERKKEQVPKKYYQTSDENKLLLHLAKDIEEQFNNHEPQKVILAGSSFYITNIKERLADNVKKKTITTISTNINENEIGNILRKNEIKRQLEEIRFAEELSIVEEFLNAIAHEMATYGFKEVKKAVDFGAVKDLLISSDVMKKYRDEDKYSEIDNIIKKAENIDSKIFIIDSKTDAGKKLDSLSGIGAVLRYKIN